MTEPKMSTRMLMPVTLAVTLGLLIAAPAGAQVGFTGPGPFVPAPFYGDSTFGLAPSGFGFMPGVETVPGTVGPYGPGVGGWEGYGIDVTGWGSGYGTGWGFGYANPYMGDGAGYSAYGESPYSLAVARAQEYAMNASRYNLINAEAAMAYQAANLYQQRALDEVINRYRQNKAIQPRYLVATGRNTLRRHRVAVNLIPREKLIDNEGKVLWPSLTPSSGQKLAELRSEVDAAVQRAAEEQKKNGRASVRTVVDARNKLSDYAAAAQARLRSDSPADAEGFNAFVQSLDHALITMGGGTMGTTAGAAPRTDLTPRDTSVPRSGGDVLKDEIRKDSGTPSTAPETSRPRKIDQTSQP